MGYGEPALQDMGGSMRKRQHARGMTDSCHLLYPEREEEGRRCGVGFLF